MDNSEKSEVEDIIAGIKSDLESSNIRGIGIVSLYDKKVDAHAIGGDARHLLYGVNLLQRDLVNLIQQPVKSTIEDSTNTISNE